MQFLMSRSACKQVVFAGRRVRPAQPMLRQRPPGRMRGVRRPGTCRSFACHLHIFLHIHLPIACSSLLRINLLLHISH